MSPALDTHPESAAVPPVAGATEPCPRLTAGLWPTTDHPALDLFRHGTPAQREAAARSLFHQYTPVFSAHIRTHWPRLPASEVQDLAARFITACLTGPSPHFLTYRPPARLRTYLRNLLEHFLIIEHRHTTALKRGAGHVPEPLDTTRPAPHHEQAAEGDGNADADAHRAFDLHWARQILAQSFAALEPVGDSPRAQERRRTLAHLLPWIIATPSEASLRDLAATLGRSYNAVRLDVHRLRTRWRTTVRDAIAATLTDPADLEDELRHLITILSVYPSH